MENEIQPFNYGEVDNVTREKLKRHEAAIKGIQSKAVYEIGEELQAVHDELANHNGGTFYAWCESIGIGRDTVKRILNYHAFVSANCTNRDILESLPKSLVYEAARPSAPKALKDGVINGDIRTLADYNELKAELKAAKEENERTRAELDSRPDKEDYELIKFQLQNMEKVHEEDKREIAQLRANNNGQSLQEWAESDERYLQYLKTEGEEGKVRSQVRELLYKIDSLPNVEAEVREMARCYLANKSDKRAVMGEVRSIIRRAIKKLEIMETVFDDNTKLKVVK